VTIRPFAREKKRFAQKFTDGRTDRRRTPRDCISSWNELKIIVSVFHEVLHSGPASSTTHLANPLMIHESTIYWLNYHTDRDGVEARIDECARKRARLREIFLILCDSLKTNAPVLCPTVRPSIPMSTRNRKDVENLNFAEIWPWTRVTGRANLRSEGQSSRSLGHKM